MIPRTHDASLPVLLILLPPTIDHPPRRLLNALRDAVLAHDQRGRVRYLHALRPARATTLQLTGEWACVPEHLWRALTRVYTDHQ